MIRKLPKTYTDNEVYMSLRSLNSEGRQDVQNIVMSQEIINRKTVEKISRRDNTTQSKESHQ